jgi:hypothetical protein
VFQGTEQKRVADKRSKKVSKRFEKTLDNFRKICYTKYVPKRETK